MWIFKDGEDWRPPFLPARRRGRNESPLPGIGGVANSFALSPYAAYHWTETKPDAYTETGGGFPASIAAAK